MNDRPPPSLASSLVRYSGMGLEMGTAVGIGAWGGWWLDRRFETAPWALLGGILLGFAAAMWMIFRSLRALSAQQRQEDDDE